MALVPAFSCTQIIGLPSVVVIQDDSTGSDVLIISRKVAVINFEGKYLTSSGGVSSTPVYITWDYADATISIACLTEDTAANITVYWLGAAGNTLYQKTTLFEFSLNGDQFSFNLTLSQAPLYPNINVTNDINYLKNRMNLFIFLKNAYTAVAIGGNIYIAQSQLSSATSMQANQNDFF